MLPVSGFPPDNSIHLSKTWILFWWVPSSDSRIRINWFDLIDQNIALTFAIKIGNKNHDISIRTKNKIVYIILVD